MSFLFATRLLQPAICLASKLAVGGAIALTINGVPAIAYAQVEFSDISLSHFESNQLLTDSSLLTDAEKIDLLDAAVLTIDNYDGEYAGRDKIRTLRGLARSYSDLGAQAQAVALLDRAVAIASDDTLRYQTPIRIVPAYIQIGEIEVAETLLAQAVASSGYIRTDYLVDIAEAYVATGNADLAASTLSLAIDYLEKLATQETSRGSIYSIGLIAQTYDQLDDAVAEAGLSRLVALIEAELETTGPGKRVSDRLATALAKLSIAQSKQGNTDAAAALAAQALEVIREGEETGYVVAEVAAAYGYIEDRGVAVQALSEMMQLAMSELSSVDPIGPVSALGAIAIAYERMGDISKSEEAVAVITEKFGDSPYMLGAILGIYIEMGDVAAQESTIQQMFDMLPLLREAGLVVSDVTAGYAGISGIVQGYVQTTDAERAQERLTLLESFFKDVPFDPLGKPGQLAILARAAASREDYKTAQRLLAEATEALAMTGCQEQQCVNVISSLATSYTFLEDMQAKQAGFDDLQQIADDRLDFEKRDSVSNMLTRARAVL